MLTPLTFDPISSKIEIVIVIICYQIDRITMIFITNNRTPPPPPAASQLHLPSPEDAAREHYLENISGGSGGTKKRLLLYPPLSYSDISQYP